MIISIYLALACLIILLLVFSFTRLLKPRCPVCHSRQYSLVDQFTGWDRTSEVYDYCCNSCGAKFQVHKNY
ncbi:hypothetical protein KKH26_00730 [Patescibacteria group bacterium]|nr:hypothetical protein [Patescibacteria group bacterium]